MIQSFKFGDEKLRTADDNWFMAKDVCRILKIRKYRDAVADLDSDERASMKVDTLGGKQTAVVVNESGLYSLIFKSRSENAREFQRWVTRDVLPTLRMTGKYEIAPKITRADTKRQRNEFTDVLRDHGCTEPKHYINVTKGMKKSLGIDENKKKSTFNSFEFGKVMFAEWLAANKIQVSDAHGYYAVKPIACDAAASVKALIENNNRPAITGAA